MRKFLIALIAVVTLGAGTAFAQSGYWAGFSVGYPGAALHFGIEDVTPNLGVRVNAGYNYIGSGFALGFDALYDLDVDTGTTPIDVYVGGGLGLGIGAGIDVAINAFVGGEFRLVDAGLPQGGIFLEAGPSFSLSPFAFGIIGRLGFNYHF